MEGLEARPHRQLGTVPATGPTHINSATTVGPGEPGTGCEGPLKKADRSMALDSEPFTGIGQNNVGWIAQPVAKFKIGRIPRP